MSILTWLGFRLEPRPERADWPAPSVDDARGCIIPNGELWDIHWGIGWPVVSQTNDLKTALEALHTYQIWAQAEEPWRT